MENKPHNSWKPVRCRSCRASRRLCGKLGARFRHVPRHTLRQDRAERACYGPSSALDDVRVDLSGPNIGVAELLLHRADIHAPLKQVRCKGVSKGVATGGLVDTGTANGSPHRLLYSAFVEMVSSALAGTRVHTHARSRKDVLPRPIPRCIRVLPGKRTRQFHRAAARLAIALEQGLAILKVSLKGDDKLIWQSHYSVFTPLSLSNKDGPVREIDVLIENEQRT